MLASPPFFDTSYLVRLYLEDRGFEQVRRIAMDSPALAAAWHGQAEIVAAFHRAYREGRYTQERYLFVLEQFQTEREGRQFRWYPLTGAVQKRLEAAYVSAPANFFLRAADALHLACAAENGHVDVYSNDRHFLNAAPLFGLNGVNIIGD